MTTPAGMRQNSQVGGFPLDGVGHFSPLESPRGFAPTAAAAAGLSPG